MTMKRTLMAGGTLGLAGLVGAGVMVFPGVADGDKAVSKREEGVTEIVVVDDADDDDTGLGRADLTTADRSRLDRSVRTDADTRSRHRPSRDHTRSRDSVSRAAAPRPAQAPPPQDWSADSRDWSAASNDASYDASGGSRD